MEVAVRFSARQALYISEISAWRVWEHVLKPSRLDKTLVRLRNRLRRQRIRTNNSRLIRS